MIRVGVVGATGYAGGELLRLLDLHPEVEVALATSGRLAGKPVRSVHPNLRGSARRPGVGDLVLQPHEAAQATHLDALFVAGPHGTSAPVMQAYLKSARRVFDLSADFRLADAAEYPRWYGWTHPEPDLLAERAYGVAELHRAEIRSARLVSGAGCIATTAILALAPLARRGLVERDRVVVDAKVGSSAAGAMHGPGTHHPERAGVVRAYAPTGHRHTAEIRQETGLDVHLSCHAVEMVRGILVTCHTFLTEELDEKAIWKAYREDYGQEPFVRVVKERTGIHRYPEPRLLAGTNSFHVGFERDPASRRLVVLGALDNLVKGTAGAAVQNLNVAFGLEETLGLEFQGLHP